MVVYWAEFRGREKGATVFYRFQANIRATSAEEAHGRLYDEYECVEQLKLTPIKRSHDESYVQGACLSDRGAF